MAAMTYSKSGLALTEQFEGCRTEAYPDPVSNGDPWTIGYGHTGPEVHEGLVWTQQQCVEALEQDIARFSAHVNKVVQIDLTQGEFDALVDFAFNCGTRNLDSSTLLKLVNEDSIAEAAEQFQRWDHACGKVVAGLLKRRLAERDEFLSGSQDD